jgi:hypothetical protein
MESTAPRTAAAFARSQPFDSTRLLLGVPCGDRGGLSIDAAPVPEAGVTRRGRPVMAGKFFLMRMIVLPYPPGFSRFLTLVKKQYTIIAERIEQVL